MNKEELNSALNYYINNRDQIGITVYVVLKGEDTPKKLDIDNESLPALKDIFVDSINTDIVLNDELSVIKLSSSDERANAIYEYDIEVPDELSALNEVSSSDRHFPFNLSNDDIKDVTALLIEIGNNERQIVLYKTMARVNLFGRSSFFLRKSNERFEQINDEFFRISPNFQLIQVADKLLVLDLKTIEKFFGFHEVIKSEAEAGVEAIEEISLLENPEVLREMVSDIPFARKLTKVANASPVLKAEIPNVRIIEFCQNFPNLNGRIRLNTDQNKIQLDTKVSKDLFIKLLMDDFLTSELTNFHYTSLAKDEANELAEPAANEEEGGRNVA